MHINVDCMQSRQTFNYTEVYVFRVKGWNTVRNMPHFSSRCSEGRQNEGDELSQRDIKSANMKRPQKNNLIDNYAIMVAFTVHVARMLLIILV